MKLIQSGRSFILQDSLGTQDIDIYYYEQNDYRINWGALGSVKPDVAKEYGELILTASQLARELNAGFDMSKSGTVISKGIIFVKDEN